MDKDAFWVLIEKARKGADLEEVPDKLVELLQELPEKEILSFERCLSECFRDAYRSDIWEVAFIMNGGCSDDGFDYFMGWLVARGRKFFEQALADPEMAAKGAKPEDEPFELEDMWTVAASAYEAKTGNREEFYERAKPVRRSLKGEPFDEETVAERHPKLAKKFGFD